MNEATLDRRISHTEKVLRLHALAAQQNRIEGSQGIHGASTTRRAYRNWRVPSGSADELLLDDLSIVRDRLEDLYRNNAIVRGLVSSTTESVIGQGLKLQCTIDRDVLKLTDQQAEEWENKTERLFDNDMKSVEIDAYRRMTGYQADDLAFRTHYLYGESFGLLPRMRRKGSNNFVKIQLVSPRRISNPWGKYNNDNLREGIEFNDAGEVIKYHVEKFDSYYTLKNEWIGVPAFGATTGRKNVLHVMRQDFANQSRGVSFLTAILGKLKNLDRYDEASLTSAIMQSMHTGWIKSNRQGALDSFFTGTTEEPWFERKQDYTMDSGLIQRINTDEDIVFNNAPQNTDGFSNYISAQVRFVAMAANQPYEVVVKEFNASFSASKGARIEAWRNYMTLRYVFASQFKDPFYSEWLADAIAAGRIEAPGFFDDPDIKSAWLNCQWFGEGPGQIDPVKETAAAVQAIDYMLTTRQKEAAKQGNDFEKNVTMQKRERRMMQEAGIEQVITKSDQPTSALPTGAQQSLWND